MRALLVTTLLTASACGFGVPERSRVTEISAGFGHTCALVADGTVRCFGRNEFGQLGLGHTSPIGDDEWPIDGGTVALAEKARAIYAGGNHSCAIGESGAVYCWGQNTFGQLGLGHIRHIGDDEAPGSMARVDIEGPVKSLALGGLHTCAVLEAGTVRCFGDATSGQLGYGDVIDIGDDESASAAAELDLGASATSVVAGMLHSCALDPAGAVRCWGRGEPPNASAPGGWGQLGYGNRENIGDNEVPSSAGNVDVGGTVVSLAAGHFHQCAVLSSGALRCWGRGEGRDNYGQLGIAVEENIGDDEPASAAGDIAIGVPIAQAAAGDVHTCAITTEGNLRCFGFGGFGQLGYGNRDNIGDDEFPEVAGDATIGSPIASVVAGKFHTCVLSAEGTVTCFGLAAGGEIGSGGTENLGDDERLDEIEPIIL